MQVNTLDAKNQSARLVMAAQTGEAVCMVYNGVPLLPVQCAALARSGPRNTGDFEGCGQPLRSTPL